MDYKTAGVDVAGGKDFVDRIRSSVESTFRPEVIGGLGGSIAEWLSSNNPCHLEMVGVQDRFGESGGSDELMDALKITEVEVVAAAKRAISRKNTP